MLKRHKEITSTVSRAFYEACDLCSHAYSDRPLLNAADIAAKQERQHRAIGKRMVGDIGPRVSVQTAAEYFALRGFLTPRRQRDYSHRMDFVAAYGAMVEVERQAQRYPDTAKRLRAFVRKWRKTIAALDYTDMIARD